MELELTSEKPSLDLKDLPEFDWDAPENQEWIKAEEDRMRIRFGHMTRKDMNKMLNIREKILTDNPGMEMEKATNLAMENFPRKI